MFEDNNKHLFDHLRSNICEIRDPGITLRWDLVLFAMLNLNMNSYGW